MAYMVLHEVDAVFLPTLQNETSSQICSDVAVVDDSRMASVFSHSSASYRFSPSGSCMVYSLSRLPVVCVVSVSANYDVHPCR